MNLENSSQELIRKLIREGKATALGELLGRDKTYLNDKDEVNSLFFNIILFYCKFIFNNLFLITFLAWINTTHVFNST